MSKFLPIPLPINFMFWIIIAFIDYQVSLRKRGYVPARGKVFKGNHVHSIVKKKKMSDEKYSRMYPSTLTNCSLEVTDKRIVNS